MIFVTLGTQAFPFDRLLRGLDGVAEELVVQGGASTHRPAGAEWFDFLDLPQLLEHVRAARVVVSHAGVGSVMTAVREGKRPVVVPRLERHGEAVDDHQLPFARRLHGIGLVRLVEDPAELPAAIAETPEPPAALPAGESRLAADLRAYLEQLAREGRA
ncbi:MAG TPA: glycosyltransferase [Gaiellaceae bacterium]|nr:glycosyltransferase [Gaiellaceae bacterium]